MKPIFRFLSFDDVMDASPLRVFAWIVTRGMVLVFVSIGIVILVTARIG